MTTRTEITPTEQADRVAIRELVDAYAHCADTRDADGQKAVFAEDTHFVVYMDGWGSDPSQVLDGREALTGPARRIPRGVAFDLVFVLGVSQLTQHLVLRHTWRGTPKQGKAPSPLVRLANRDYEGLDVRRE
jgi:hypothetical protein